jgi:diguanylate cyclase (GGDEF)-like protein
LLEDIEKLSQILNESYSEKSLQSSLSEFFKDNFKVNKFVLNIDNSSQISNPEFSYPIYKHKKCLGSLDFSNADSDTKKFVQLAAQFISLKIQNIMLNDKMQRDIDFHETMKNIAKMIETQYELKYIIPIIGEMLDKFFEDYLIYIFLMDENKKINELSWPNNCKDNIILELVKNLNDAKMSEDNKIYALPLISEGKNVGSVVAKSTAGKISSKDKEYFELLATQIAITINRANVYAEILKHATLDALTGFYNRRQLEERIKQEVSNAKRQHAPLCGIMTDIDFFKGVNDTYGHAVGDLVLKTIAKVIRGQLREYDIAGRYGGEEFSILLPFTKISEAKMVAERLRQTIADKTIDISKINPDSEVKKINITMSLGIYEIKEDDNEDDLLRKADKALYQAKNTGRNKVVVYYD